MKTLSTKELSERSAAANAMEIDFLRFHVSRMNFFGLNLFFGRMHLLEMYIRWMLQDQAVP